MKLESAADWKWSGSGRDADLNRTRSGLESNWDKSGSWDQIGIMQTENGLEADWMQA